MGAPSSAGSQQRINEIALDHAWHWFTLHASQRMQAMNFFLVASAFVSAGLVNAITEEEYGVTLVVAVAGMVLTLGFALLEIRTRQLVHAAEDALEPLQDELASLTGVSSLAMLRAVEKAKLPGAKYSVAFLIIYLVMGSGFVAATTYAVCQVL